MDTEDIFLFDFMNL